MPVPTPVPDSLVNVKFNENGQVNWFGGGASFPAGKYKIDASGWYTHWSPKPSVTKCIDMGLDPCAPGGDGIAVCMPAWGSRGQNYPSVPVSDANRLGMHVKYGSDDSPVYKLRVEPGILVFYHTGGQIGIWDNDNGYRDNSVDARYILSYLGGSTPVVPSTDTDGDGLPDFVEAHGFMDSQGRVYYTDPNKKDTDSDSVAIYMPA